LAQLDAPGCIELLPDIDFNIRGGNALAGGSSYPPIAVAANAASPQVNTVGLVIARGAGGGSDAEQ
jgi:hypothetical protein